MGRPGGLGIFCRIPPPPPNKRTMPYTHAQVMEIAKMAATIAIQKDRAERQPPAFTTKAALARHLDVDRRTINAMIQRGEVIITKERMYTKHTNKKSGHHPA